VSLILAAAAALLAAARSARVRSRLPDAAGMRSRLPDAAGMRSRLSALPVPGTGGPGGVSPAQALRSRLPGRLGGSQPGDVDWQCPECGARYRVTGTDRHQVYWPAGAQEADPVMGDACTKCGTPFPVAAHHQQH
jgi:hypothetical protein